MAQVAHEAMCREIATHIDSSPRNYFCCTERRCSSAQCTVASTDYVRTSEVGGYAPLLKGKGKVVPVIN
jgi:hypothetical protein